MPRKDWPSPYARGTRRRIVYVRGPSVGAEFRILLILTLILMVLLFFLGAAAFILPSTGPTGTGVEYRSP